MAPFKNAQESHEHSRETLDVLYGYDAFLDSIEIMADMGCGRGLDTEWWAKLETRDDPPEPRNILCYAVDKNISQVDSGVTSLSNVRAIPENFETHVLPRKLDLIWCHDSFQHVINPFATLANWHRQMNVDGMLILIIRQNVAYEYNRLVQRGYNYQYHNFNLVNLIYMLAVSGFDCRDAYAKKQENNPWLHLAVYKSQYEPMNPAETSWFDLADKNMLHESVVQSLNKYNYVRQEDIVYPWLDKDFYQIKE